LEFGGTILHRRDARDQDEVAAGGKALQGHVRDLCADLDR
jgi:hypothetical protein